MDGKKETVIDVRGSEQGYTPIEFIARTTEEDLLDLGVDTIADVMKNELIRCRNCGWYKEEGNGEVKVKGVKGEGKCEAHDIAMGSDDFCSYAIRKYQKDETVKVYPTIEHW